LVRVGFTADGSYYVTSPYHPESKALLWLATVNYTLDESRMTFDEAIELASTDDDQSVLKLSHHVSGWVQFSGQGIVSGFDAHGEPKGVAVHSYPLLAPSRGPAF